MPSIQEKITNFILQKLKKILFYLVLVGIFFVGFSIYQWYYKKSADWHTATLYFNDNQPPYTGEFAFENGKIVQEKRYKDCTTKKSGKTYRKHCKTTYFVYVSKESKEFPTDKVEKIMKIMR